MLKAEWSFMQFAKDSFYMTLLTRLSALNPQRTVMLNGVTRPAVIVAENELVIPIDPLPDAFYIEWGKAEILKKQMGDRAIMSMECVISYHTLGKTQSGVDRGRALGELDTELLSICQPQHAEKRDYTQAPSVDLGTTITWTAPAFSEVTGVDARYKTDLAPRLERRTALNVFFFPEVNFL
jgi:hypothetical protein